MLVSEGVMKWVMNLYPPLLFQRIRIKNFEKDFKGASVKISKSILNQNYNKSIFGGTIFSAADPLYPVLFYQMLLRRGYKITAWSRSATVRFFKPSLTDLFFDVTVKDEDIIDCENQLNVFGKYKHSFPVDIYDRDKVLCATIINEIYVRNLSYIEINKSAD